MRKASVSLEAQPELVMNLCRHLGLQVNARFDPSGEDELFPNRITLEGADAQWLLSNRGQGLDAMQFLLHEAHGVREEEALAYLDVQKSRLFRMREVQAMTAMAMEKARQFGSFSFASLNPRERRWVHLLVSRESDLQSESEGTGSMKSLKISRKA